MNKEAIIKTLKEAGRIALFGAITALVGFASEQLAGLDPNSVYFVAGTLALKLVDKYLHENQDVKVKGLAPF